jgi:hypothetical protein
LVALIGGSIALLIGAMVTLVLGWAGEHQYMLFVSIAASSGAAIMLALAYARSRE